MSIIQRLIGPATKKPLSLWMKSKIVPDNVIDELEIDPSRPIFYVIKTNSISDKFAISQACKKLSMPSPYGNTIINGQEIETLLCIENPQPVIFGKANKTRAIDIGGKILKAHLDDETLDAQCIPITICWGREPGIENDDIQSLIADAESPSWLRKFFIVMFSGRFNLVRFSRPVSIRTLVNKHGADQNAGNKLIRIARFHFYRQKLIATGPRLWTREQMINGVISAPAVEKVINEQVKATGESREIVRQKARKIADEIGADYRENLVRVGSRFLTWLWNKLYNGIKVNNAQAVRDLAEQGHEIIYVPCHRSHMDYLLLSFVIFNQGMVPPHIAAGINLNFGPVGPILRRGGAFYLRRSFKGNRLYGAVFNEYLSQLFAKGYSVEYYTEGGRSRTGRLLPPKTGMLAMTIQSALKGIDRPISFVPVYMGYEHVMEVNTYLKELKGSNKKSESMLGILKAARKLRDYGFGYVNFGEPISLKDYLNKSVPKWKDDINPNEPPKPEWLPATCNKLAKDIMTRINNATALNATTLTAMVLLATDRCAMSADELKAQLDCYIKLQTDARYSNDVTLPHMNGEQMIEHVSKLKKVEVTRDTFGDLINLSEKESILMTYYRNNIIHLFAIPSFIAAQIISHGPQSSVQIVAAVEHLILLFKDEWFLRDIDINSYCGAIIASLIEQKLLIVHNDVIRSPAYQSAEFFRLDLLANIIQNTLQRYAIVLNVVNSSYAIGREELEQKALVIGQRLAARHGINSPEFLDKKVIISLIESLLKYRFIEEQSATLTARDTLDELNTTVTSLLNNRIMQSITQIL